MDSTRDFFISYNAHDKQNAEWIAYILEEAGYSTFIQAWDFGPGTNFVVEMDLAARCATYTIAVLSPTYLASAFCRPEWSAAFATDPTSIRHRLIPVRVVECELTGLLAQIVYIDLVGKEEDEARKLLLEGVSAKRSKPTQRPVFKSTPQSTPPPAPLLAQPSTPPTTNHAPVTTRQTGPDTSCIYWTVPYQRNRFFTGRDRELEGIHQIFSDAGTQGSIQLIAGLGGMGKTQLALEYAFRYRDEYRAVFWVRAGSEQELLNDYRAIALELDLPEKDVQDPATTVIEWLEKNSGWLLILNNVIDAASIKRFLPTLYSGHILLTSRVAEMRGLGIATPRQLGQWSEEEALHFLLNGTDCDKDDGAEMSAARELIQELGALPLALEQAAAYIQEKQARFQSYLKSFRRRRLALLDAQASETGDYPQSVATTWDINIEPIKKKSPASFELLQLSAFLGADRIPLEILTSAANELGDLLAEALKGADEDELLVDDLLQPLTRYSLISRHNKTQSFDVHPLVQEVTRTRMGEDERKLWSERAVRAVKRILAQLNRKDWTRSDRLLPHALVCDELIENSDIQDLAAIELRSDTGHYLYRRGQYAQAEKILQRAKKVITQIPVPTDIMARVPEELGIVLFAQKRFKEAETEFLQAFNILREDMRELSRRRGCILINLANCYINLSQTEKAEELFQQALDIMQKAQDAQPYDVPTVLNGLATICVEQHRYSEAEALFRQAYPRFKQASGKDHPDTISCQVNIAEACALQERYTEAEALYKEAIAIAEISLGVTHPLLAVYLHLFANLYIAQELYTQAMPICQRAYDIMLGTFGAEHPQTMEYLRKYDEVARKTHVVATNRPF